MINLSTNKQLDLLIPNTNKALALVLQEATPKELETLSKDKDLKSILNSLLKQSAQNSTSDKTLLTLVKNNSTLKELGNVSATIKDLLTTLKADKNHLPITRSLKNFFIDIKELSEPLLKQKIENSGVFLESKLKKEIVSLIGKAETSLNIKDLLSGDLKAVLLKASDEITKSSHPNQAELLKSIDKLSLSIDYYQLLSHLSNSSCIYLPFSWEQLEEGNINLQKDKDDKFYCDIDLKLKEYGELKLRLVLYEKNQINIQIHSENKDLKEIVKENIALLRSALIESQITPREIRIFDAAKKNTPSPYENDLVKIDVGFEVKA